MTLDRHARPRLRNVEAFPVDGTEGRGVALRDPSGYTDAILVLPVPLLDIVSLFDGEHSLGDIQEVILRRHGELVDSDRIGEVAQALDEHGFLDSARFAIRRAQIDDAFRASPSRPAAHAGGAYARDTSSLRAQMDAFFRGPAGPGAVDWAVSDGTGRLRPIRGLVAPHIDFHRGGPAYAWGYRALAERTDADCFVILGTCHAGMDEPFALTRKDFDTPLGPAPVDHDLADALARRVGDGLLSSELAHRAEHSIEFQAVFLRYLLAGRREFTILPVLASFVHEAIVRGQAPEADPRIPRVLDALADSIAASSRRVCVIAAADLAHVGPRFGDPDPVTPTELAHLEREDRTMLAAAESGDPAAFFDTAARDGDRRRVCGLSPIYAALRVLGGARGELRRYAQWPDPNGTVTFASLTLT
jgi:hypothetical protein